MSGFPTYAGQWGLLPHRPYSSQGMPVSTYLLSPPDPPKQRVFHVHHAAVDGVGIAVIASTLLFGKRLGLRQLRREVTIWRPY